MSFDPYYKWLGIPRTEQPPNYYRLLGIPPYTDDSTVIAHAASRQIKHIRSFESGEHAAVSRKILKQLAKARKCLLDAESREIYDAKLRHSTEVNELPPANSAKPDTDLVIATQKAVRTAPAEQTPATSNTSSKRKKKKSSSASTEIVKTLIGGVIGLAVGYFVLCMIGPQYDFLGLMGQSKEVPDRVDSTGPDRTNDEDRTTQPDSGSVAPNVEPKPFGTNRSNPGTFGQFGNNQLPGGFGTTPAVEPTETKEEQLVRLASERDIALEAGNLTNALSKVREIAELDGSDPLEAQAELVLGAETADKKTRAAAFLTIMESAIATKDAAFAKTHQDRLLRMAREVGDADLVRRATLVVLEIPSMSPAGE